jgi:hypothetical protein
MTMLAQYLAVGAIVVAALGYLLGRLRRRLRDTSPAAATGCGTCGTCQGCAPVQPTDTRVAAARGHPAP